MRTKPVTKLTLTPAAKSAIAHGSAYARVRRAAYLEMAQKVLSNPSKYPDLVHLAKQVVDPVLPNDPPAS